ncbi:histidine phosphatase family protein [Pengzhenrongella frigida]|uniref:Histidine phosphatase family protein n=1 Tax=Pengzhenrongella frigida TaxID=1259133 RepID=A0A4V1ZGZ0_9MICO|nr:histidine phosphatase family protein [Cellulomonas sp. HLT2-17]RYV50214.1 histidine phosphatase family protein [Cellulomonas sp. HLT2-17]
MRLILVRHGQSPSNVQHLLDTAEPGPGLTDLGHAQAAALGPELAAELVDAVYASSLVRAQQTAGPLARALGLPIHIRAGIREISAGELEMRGDVTSVERYLSTVFAWPAGDLARRMPGGENGTEVLARFDAVVAEVAGAGDRTALMVSHGAAIRVWTAARARNIDVSFAATHTLTNTGVVILEGDPVRGWHVVSWTGADVEAGLDVGVGDGSAGMDPGFL